MKILVTDPLDPHLVSGGLGPLVVYRPDLSEQPNAALLDVLCDVRPRGLLTFSDIKAETLAAWQERTPGPVQLIRRQGNLDLSREAPDSPLAASGGGDLMSDIEALGIAERRLIRADTRDRLAALGSSDGLPESLVGAKVTLVGAGIVNLITALSLVERGASVDIVDGGPDPRKRPPWQQLGATHGGENARMFCYTEADNYNEKAHIVYAQMREVFSRTIRQGGWLMSPPDRLTAREKAWLSSFLDLPRWQAEVFTRDIHDFNIASGSLWEKLRRHLPDLFTDVVYTPGVLRVYPQAEKVEAAKRLHARIGSLERVLDPEELKHEHPGFREAVDGGEIAGALEIRGFTLSIHRMVNKLLARLEAKGVRCQWNLKVRGFERDADGSVTGLLTAGETLRSKHYVVSPGVYGRGLLEGTESAGKIQGILGLWALLPHNGPLHRRSIKIHREGHVGEDSNVTIGRDDAGKPILILGSGYGFLGEQQLDMDSPEISRLFEALEETAKRFFPSAYHQAIREDSFYGSRKACVRPFTSTGLGVFEVLPTSDGGRLVITGGHNTGGFTQSPVIAEAVLATLEGAEHPMQSLYRPDRERPTLDAAKAGEMPALAISGDAMGLMDKVSGS